MVRRSRRPSWLVTGRPRTPHQRATERQLEDAIVAKLAHFLTELGEGFAFVGRQVQLRVGDDDFYIELLFYHLGLRCYIIIELKVDRPRPAAIGQLSFYVTVVDDLIRRPKWHVKRAAHATSPQPNPATPPTIHPAPIERHYG